MSDYKGLHRMKHAVADLFLTDNILFSAWKTLSIVENEEIETARIGVFNGLPQYQVNPVWVDSLTEKELKTLIVFEGMRIILKHPFSRRRPDAVTSLLASNVTLREHVGTQLEMPEAKQMFEHMIKDDNFKQLEKLVTQELQFLADPEIESQYGKTREELEDLYNNHPATFDEGDLDKRYFEFYYSLFEQDPEGGSGYGMTGQGDDENDEESQGGGAPGEGEGEEDQEGGGSPSEGLEDHLKKAKSIAEQSEGWGEDAMIQQKINEKIQEAQATQSWGSITGNFQDAIVASLVKKPSFIGIIKKWNGKMAMSDKRAITRMKPSRRHGWLSPGVKREGSPRILMAFDISGSMSNKTLSNGFGMFNRICKVTDSVIDIVQFDCSVCGKIEEDVTKKTKFDIKGRGGTDFDCIVDLCEEHPGRWDGVIVFTDTYASSPKPSKSQKNWLWCADNYQNYEAAKSSGTFPYGKLVSIAL